MKETTITSHEWRWAVGWSVVVVLLNCLPYFIAAVTAPEGWQFAGILVNPYDGNSYLAKIQQGIQGDWLFHLTYTPEPHEGAFIFTFYLALGHVAALLGLPPLWMFHLARVAGGLALLLVAFRFITAITPQLQERRLAFGLMFSASGLGWLGAAFGAFPIDLWVPEAFVPYSLYANPHFPLAMMLMLIILQHVIQPKPFNLYNTQFIAVSLAALGLSLILPFALLTTAAVLLVFLAWLYISRRCLPWPHIWLTLSVGLFSAPIILYDFWVYTTNPILAGWSAQNITTAPSLLNLLLGYGLVGVLAIGGGWWIVRQRAAVGEWLVFWWAVTSLILLYLPFDLQRRLITGLHLPLCILAAVGLQRWLAQSSLKPGHHRLITTTIVAMGALGTLFVWSLPLLATRQSPETFEPTSLLFIRPEEEEAFAWLRQNVTPDSVVLASPRLGMFIPGQAGVRVFYGHPFETIAAKQKKAQVEAFYRGEIETVMPPVDFIIYGPEERKLGQPQNLAAWPMVFSTNDLFILAPLANRD